MKKVCTFLASGLVSASAINAVLFAPVHAEQAEVISLADDAGFVESNDNAPPALPVSFADKTPDPEKQAGFEAAMREADARQRVFGDAAAAVKLDGSFVQGGLVFGQAVPGAKVTLNGEPVMVGDDGRFLLGFGRDAGPTALLVVDGPDARSERRSLEIADREFPVDRIDGLDQSKVSGFTEAQLAKIGDDVEKKKAARVQTQTLAEWANGFDWPVTGRVSGVFGSQRILNGEPKRPHSGLDVAAAAGTPIIAPAAGIVRLADSDMYFEGGLVLLDHGHWLESAFLHMSRLDVKPGDHVEKGQVIGAVGATGRATGPHMHWSVKWAGTLVDPQLLVADMAIPGEIAAGAEN